MYIEKVEVTIAPGFTENCYILSDAPDATHVIVVDPGAQAKKLLAAVGDRTVDSIVLTHRHYDHVGALAKLVAKTGAEVIAHELDAQAVADPDIPPPRLFTHTTFKSAAVTKTVTEGDLIAVGSEQLLVLHTPGHTVGSMCLYDEKGHNLIAGDTLFREAVGRTDLASGSASQQQKTLKKLAQLPDETKVYPGHEEDTTIAHEKRYGHLRYSV
ncbi:MAG: MBL fold metallo-hydrolase [Coriobacteriales bacterium]|jgi:glyoxylase-like metal-dependent hydrolase (beta-lactamase superfamily II)|nr:MBL fold metallo-hydrolase [Coriobacteriales bacterium]